MNKNRNEKLNDSFQDVRIIFRMPQNKFWVREIVQKKATMKVQNKEYQIFRGNKKQISLHNHLVERLV